MMVKEERVFSLLVNNRIIEVKVGYSIYECNHALAVMLMCNPPEYDEVFSSITVNLPYSRHYCTKQQFIDVNNWSYIGEWLQNNYLAIPTGRKSQSGWVKYPEYKFLIDEQIILDISNIF